MTPEWRLTEGDTAEELRRIPDQQAHTVITDPPYGIAFMNNDWDRFGSGIRGMREFQAWTAEWAQEAARGTKPGANWLVFASPRTVHRTACGLEDAGIEIIDCLMWVFGEGFPEDPDGTRRSEHPAEAGVRADPPRTHTVKRVGP